MKFVCKISPFYLVLARLSQCNGKSRGGLQVIGFADLFRVSSVCVLSSGYTVMWSAANESTSCCTIDRMKQIMSSFLDGALGSSQARPGQLQLNARGERTNASERARWASLLALLAGAAV